MDFIKEAVRQNSHWETGRVEFYRVTGRLVERRVFSDVVNSFGKKFVTALRGLRRTGKSFLARKLLQKIASDSKKPESAAWFEFDRAMNASPEDLAALLNFFGSKGARAIVLDEIAFVPAWQDVLKRFYDQSNLKFVVTGSSALELDKRTSESLAGRLETINVKPFTLEERIMLKGGAFAEFKATEFGKAKFEQALVLEGGEYLYCGGLPEISVERNEMERSKYINESLLNPLFYKDMPGVFPRANPELLRKTLEILAGTASSTFQLQTIAQILGCSHPTAAMQVDLLERALLVKTIFNYTPSVAKQKRTAKKIVFADNGILSALRPECGAGSLAENAALNALEGEFFWRDAEGREVDCILHKEKTAVEVKFQEHVSTQDEKNLAYFLERRKNWKGVIITRDESERGDIARVPLWKVLLQGKMMH